MSYRTIDAQVAGRAVTIAINRPDRINALTPTVSAEMTAAIDRAVSDGARAIVLTGTRRAFCSGADLLADQDDGLPADLGTTVDRDCNPFVRKIAALDVPFLTAINGPAVGAGLSLALLGDVSVMARSAYLMLAFVNVGLVQSRAGRTQDFKEAMSAFAEKRPPSFIGR